MFSRSFIRKSRIPHARMRTAEYLAVALTGVQLPGTMMQTRNGDIVKLCKIDFPSSQFTLV